MLDNRPSHFDLQNSRASVKAVARVAGLLYLVVIVCAGFSEGFVRASLVVPGDAAATAANIRAGESLYRLGFVADLVAFLSDAGVAVLFYVLLRPVSRTLSLLAAALRLLAHPAIASVNMLNHFAALQLVQPGAALTAFEPQQLEALALLALDVHTTGYLIAGVFFGAHCLLLGYLLYRSPAFPRVLGVLLALAALGYLAESFGTFVWPGHEALLAWVVGVPAAVGEVGLCLWLLAKGVRTEQPAARAAAG